ncbi:hypothetical protein Q0590_05785 [Rhodocytophaga aerolata]|uniref:DUF4025 domain-containing protein n=1 Tax=Rhodocytophaga aerolata TaxID=455078 RepID=A0ABT8R525_9BACT|nr:hypothetical protein [Rhodocytophaga aerolata]MDO1445750.1 hypothetical protein [Rhodocytophaga aerolata]
MNPENENMPIGDNEDQFTEGSYQAIKKADSNPDEKGTVSAEKDSTKTITDLQDERKEGNSAEDQARQEGPYGVQEDEEL